MGETKGTIRLLEGAAPPTEKPKTSSSSPVNSWNDNEGGHSSKRTKYLNNSECILETFDADKEAEVMEQQGHLIVTNLLLY